MNKFKGLIKLAKQAGGNEVNKEKVCRYMGRHGYNGYHPIDFNRNFRIWSFYPNTDCQSRESIFIFGLNICRSDYMHVYAIAKGTVANYSIFDGDREILSIDEIYYSDGTVSYKDFPEGVGEQWVEKTLSI